MATRVTLPAGRFAPVQEARHGQPSVIADVRLYYMNSSSSAPSLLAIVFGVVIAIVFIIPTIITYNHTPPDPQKAVGYIMIVGYGLFIGIFAASAAFLISKGFGVLQEQKRSFIQIAFGIPCGVIAAFLFYSRFMMQ